MIDEKLKEEILNDIANRRLNRGSVIEEINKVQSLLSSDNITVIIHNNKHGMEYVELTSGLFDVDTVKSKLNERLNYLNLSNSINDSAIDMAINRLNYLENHV
jgi:hypothetical protein